MKLFTRMLVFSSCCLTIIAAVSFGSDTFKVRPHQKVENEAIQNKKETVPRVHPKIDTLHWQSRYKSAIDKALNQSNKKIYSIWNRSEISSNTSWVSYRENWKVKRVSDFKNNQIRITTEFPANNAGIDLKKAYRITHDELFNLLSTNIRQAWKNDPIDQSIHKNLRFDEGEIAKDLSSQLVYQELFKGKHASKQEVYQTASKLMNKAYLVYSEQYTQVRVYGDTNNALPKKVTYVIPLPANRLKKKIGLYHSVVHKYARSENIAPSLLYAIIHTESHFNPMARSHIPAYGLMQIVPATAGIDATRYLFKEGMRLSPAYLYNPEKNIQIGSAYLKLIHQKYFKEIKNPKSRLYCTIAAYNTGPSNVARAFGDAANIQKAVVKINRLSSAEVLEQLLNKLPANETKNYLRKVLSRQSLYLEA